MIILSISAYGQAVDIPPLISPPLPGVVPPPQPEVAPPPAIPPAPPKGSKTEGAGGSVALSLSYSLDSRNPDIFRLKKGQF